MITVLKPENAFHTEIKHTSTIDIWSFNYAKGMLLLVAHLLSRTSKAWASCKVRLFVLTTLQETEHKNLQWVVKDMLEKFRLLPDVLIEVIEISAQMSEPFTAFDMDKLEESKSDPVNLMKLSYY